jgi:Putative zincin peptidase
MMGKVTAFAHPPPAIAGPASWMRLRGLSPWRSHLFVPLFLVGLLGGHAVYGWIHPGEVWHSLPEEAMVLLALALLARGAAPGVHLWLTGTRPTDLRFGSLAGLTVRSTTAVSARNYGRAAAAPAVLGLATSLVGIAGSSPALATLGAGLVLVTAADGPLLWRLRCLPPDAPVVDRLAVGPCVRLFPGENPGALEAAPDVDTTAAAPTPPGASAGRTGSWALVSVPLDSLVRAANTGMLLTLVIVPLCFPLLHETSHPTLGPLWWFAVYLASLYVHEGLHAVGMLMAGCPAESIRFGRIGDSAMYCGTTATVSVRQLRFLVGLPGFCLGVVPLVVGMAWGSLALAVFGGLEIAMAAGDIAVIHGLRRFPGTALALDDERIDPTCPLIGAWVFVDADPAQRSEAA